MAVPERRAYDASGREITHDAKVEGNEKVLKTNI